MDFSFLKKGNAKRLLTTILYVFFAGMTIALALFAGLSLQGFSESFVSGQALIFGEYLTNFVIYDIFFVIALICIIYPITRAIVFSKNPDADIYESGSTGWLILCASQIYEIESSLLYQASESLGYSGKQNIMRWAKNPLRVLVISIILFSVYGIFLISYPQIAVNGVPQLVAQQFTPESEVIFSSFVPSFAENGLLLFVFMFFLGLNLYATSRLKWGKIGYFTIGFFICILMGFLWGSFHSLVYGNSDASLWATRLFGFMGSLITLLTGTFIFWWIWHLSNNAFITLAKLSSANSDTQVVVGIIIFILAMVWLGVELLSRKVKKSRASA